MGAEDESKTKSVNMKIKPWMSFLIVSLVILVTAFLFYHSGTEGKSNVSNESTVDYGKLDDVVFDVKTEKVKRGDLLLYVNANGLVRASEELEITSNISGIINKLNIVEGSVVKKNDLLLSFDDREYELALNDSKVKVTDARVEYGFLMKESPDDTSANPKAKEIENQIDKLEKEFRNGKLKEKEYNTLRDELDMKLIFTGAKREEVVLNKSGLTAAINAYKRARFNFEYTKILAPFNGVIGDFDLVLGQRIGSGQKLFKIFNTSSLIIDVGVLENDISKVSSGTSVKISAPSLTGQFIGRVVNISPYINAETKTCKVTIKIDNPSRMLKPGMFVNVMIEKTNLKDRILIPKEALLVRDKRNLVFVVEGNLAKWKYVDIGEQNDNYIEINDGVLPGEDVIVEGQYTLAHDAKVKIIN